MAGQLPPLPNLSYESELAARLNIANIAGIDEAGRGALAGPVFAAAVVLPLRQPDLVDHLRQVNDSKLLSVRIREQLYPLICEKAVTFGVGLSAPDLIDCYGIMAATRAAMSMAVQQLSPSPEALLIDGRIRLAELQLPQRGIVRGDQLSLSIAAASILAKVSRDRYMAELDACFPGYGFDRHKGYGTKSHLDALARLGPCPEHRLSFAPLRSRLF